MHVFEPILQQRAETKYDCRNRRTLYHEVWYNVCAMACFSVLKCVTVTGVIWGNKGKEWQTNISLRPLVMLQAETRILPYTQPIHMDSNMATNSKHIPLAAYESNSWKTYIPPWWEETGVSFSVTATTWASDSVRSNMKWTRCLWFGYQGREIPST